MTGGSLTEPLRETLAVFDDGEPRGTNEVAKRLDLGRRSTYDRLDRLVDHGYLHTKKVGASARIWWRPGSSTPSRHSRGEADAKPDGNRGSDAAERGIRADSQSDDPDRPKSDARVGGGDRFEMLVDAIEEYAIFLIDSGGRVRTWNEGARRIQGYEADEILGKHVSIFYTEADRNAGVPEDHLTDARTRGAVECHGRRRRQDGTKFRARGTLTAIRNEGGDLQGYATAFREVTDRRDRALEESEQRYRSLADNFPNGVVALFDEDLEYTLAAGQPLSEFGLDPDELVGMDVGQLFRQEDVSERVREYCRAVLDGTAHEIEFEFEFQDRLFDAWAVPVTDESGAVFAGMIMTQDATDRIERERELERQREQLTALNHLHDIVRDVTDAVIEQSTREDIEAIVCEQLAASDSYLFAWFSEVDPKTMSVEPKVEAGVDGYLDAISLSTSPDEPTGRGPAGRAIQTQEIQVVQNVYENSDFEPWREAAETYGYRSAAAIPVTYEGTTYGVLGLYADRTDAFSDAERSVISQIGEVVGHAIAALERKRVLMSDEVMEVEFRIINAAETFGVPDDGEGAVNLERLVPIDDETFLEYGTATGDGLAAIEAAVANDRLSHWESFSVIESTGDETRVEIRFSKPPVGSIIAAHGGDYLEARFQDGDYYFRVHLPPDAEVRQIVDAIMEIYPNAETVSQRHLTRDRGSSQLSESLLEGLTGRQRAAIVAAYHAGYFDSPRKMAGEDVAASMGVSAPTFHQHLRKGLQRLLATTLETA